MQSWCSSTLHRTLVNLYQFSELACARSMCYLVLLVSTMCMLARMSRVKLLMQQPPSAIDSNDIVVPQ